MKNNPTVGEIVEKFLPSQEQLDEIVDEIIKECFLASKERIANEIVKAISKRLRGK